MQRNLYRSFFFVLVAITSIVAAASAQHARNGGGGGGGVRTDTRILYHNGPVLHGTSDLYLILYGNWTGNTTPNILTDAVSNLGSTPYFEINTTYPNGNGAAPNGAIIYGGTANDVYSRGTTLTVDDIQQIVANQIDIGALPLDSAGIYLVITSADITNIDTDGSSYCTPGSSPHHGVFNYGGTTTKYGHLGSALRCPTSTASQFLAPNGSRLPTPNDNFEADAMASTIARLLNVIVTSPFGTAGPFGGWYDRYGLENSDKCAGTYGTTYTLPNGARANMQLGQRHFLIQQNWVNDRRGRCALSLQ